MLGNLRVCSGIRTCLKTLETLVSALDGVFLFSERQTRFMLNDTKTIHITTKEKIYARTFGETVNHDILRRYVNCQWIFAQELAKQTEEDYIKNKFMLENSMSHVEKRSQRVKLLFPFVKWIYTQK